VRVPESRIPIPGFIDELSWASIQGLLYKIREVGALPESGRDEKR